MKQLVLVLSVVTVLSGCSQKTMTNDEIIAEKNKCLAANMDYEMVMNVLTYEIVGVHCTKPIVKPTHKPEEK